MSNNKYSLAQLAAIYTVYKDLDGTRIARCCTCGKSMRIEQLEDCYNLYGHYLSRSTHPGLKFHPNNTHAQCPVCNLQYSSIINKKYHEYMVYRYGEDIDNVLMLDEEKGVYGDNDETLNFYILGIIELSQKFPELVDIVVDKTTGEVLDKVELIENPIEKQWNSYSVTYRQDLDSLSHMLYTEPIEYERL